MIKLTDLIKEAIYTGMVGIHELTLFYDSADPELKLEVDMMLENGHVEKAWETILNFLKKIGKLTVLTEDENYRGNHSAPDRTDDPVYNLTTTYPDIYTSPEAYRFYGYGSNETLDRLAVSIYRSIKDKPNLKIRVYRAVPMVLTSQEKLEDIEKQKKYILKTGKIPAHVKYFTDKSKYYDYLCNEEERIKKKMTSEESEVKINPGDWVTPIRDYAVTHGKTEFDRYRILSKVVPVKDLYTDGNSIFEWGYDPS